MMDKENWYRKNFNFKMIVLNILIKIKILKIMQIFVIIFANFLLKHREFKHSI